MLDQLHSRFRTDPPCSCTTTREHTSLTVDASNCPGNGDLTAAPACRATTLTAIGTTPVDAIIVEAAGRSYRYDDETATLLSTAAHTAVDVTPRDPTLATRLRHHPIQTGTTILDRAGPVATIADRTGLADCLESGPTTIPTPITGPVIAHSRIDPTPPPDSELDTQRNLDDFTTVRTYTTPHSELPTYHLEPPATRLTATDCQILVDAHELLALGPTRGGVQAPAAAINRIDHSTDTPPELLTTVLEKHTQGYGVLEDLFTDPTVSDVFAPAPIETTPLRVTADDQPMHTNIRLTRDGGAALASTLRRTSGNPFSRATPTIDADITLDTTETTIRATGVTDPASDGYGFAFRTTHDTAWTIPRLVANDTLTTWTAALLSIAVERGAAILVAGARGAGKTTLLSALLWELPAATRIVTIEDTPELPVSHLRTVDRDVQAMHTNPNGFDPSTALRTALRMGDGAIVVGEVRGHEAAVLYEAMRVGANASAVLGTIHGTGTTGVRERVVSDLDVPRSSFATTDLVVTIEHNTTRDTGHHLATIEEVTGPAAGDAAPLYDVVSDAGDTGRLDRGSSTLIPTLTASGETYADIQTDIERRQHQIEELVADDRTRPTHVVQSHARRRSGA